MEGIYMKYLNGKTAAQLGVVLLVLGATVYFVSWFAASVIGAVLACGPFIGSIIKNKFIKPRNNPVIEGSEEGIIKKPESEPVNKPNRKEKIRRSKVFSGKDHREVTLALSVALLRKGALRVNTSPNKENMRNSVVNYKKLLWSVFSFLPRLYSLKEYTEEEAKIVKWINEDLFELFDRYAEEIDLSQPGHSKEDEALSKILYDLKNEVEDYKKKWQNINVFGVDWLVSISNNIGQINRIPEIVAGNKEICDIDINNWVQEDWVSYNGNVYLVFERYIYLEENEDGELTEAISFELVNIIDQCTYYLELLPLPKKGRYEWFLLEPVSSQNYKGITVSPKSLLVPFSKDDPKRAKGVQSVGAFGKVFWPGALRYGNYGTNYETATFVDCVTATYFEPLKDDVLMAKRIGPKDIYVYRGTPVNRKHFELIAFSQGQPRENKSQFDSYAA